MAAYSRRKGHRLMSQINVVPYIDVMLVLLVIFMVTAPLITTTVIDLPSIGRSGAPPAAPIEIIIKDKDAVFLRDRERGQGERRVDLDELVKTPAREAEGEARSAGRDRRSQGPALRRCGRDHGPAAAEPDQEGRPAGEAEPMTNTHPEPGRVTSGVLAVAVHVAFIMLLVFGISWQQRVPEPVVVDLWQDIPPPKPEPIVRPAPEPPPPPPAPKVEAQPPAPRSRPSLRRYRSPRRSRRRCRPRSPAGRRSS